LAFIFLRVRFTLSRTEAGGLAAATAEAPPPLTVLRRTGAVVEVFVVDETATAPASSFFLAGTRAADEAECLGF
jgi:hypothetical protein